MSKEAKFIVKIDTSEFDRSIEKMQRQLKATFRTQDVVGGQRQTAQRMQGMGLDGGVKPSAAAYFKSIQSARADMDKLIVKEKKHNDELLKSLTDRATRIEKVKVKEAELIKGSERQLALAKQIEQAEANLYRSREQHAHRSKLLNQAMDARNQMGPKDKLERIMTAMAGGGIKGGIGEVGVMAKAGWEGLGMSGQVGLVLAGLTAALKTAQALGEAYVGYKGIPLEVQRAQGSAVSQTFGREIGAIGAGRGSQEIIYGEEKRRADELAKVKARAQFEADKSLSGRGKLQSGDPMRQLEGAIQTGFFAVLGEMGMGGSAGKMALGNLPGNFGREHQKKYAAEFADEMAKNYAEATENIKAQNPMKTATIDDFQQRQMNDLMFQRRTGLDYSTFHGKGGFREQMINGGFTDQMGMEAAGGIMGAGGSTRMARDPMLALQASRNLDLTNAPQLLGKISGQMGDTASSRQVFINMIAEGNKLGYASPEYREENRKLLDSMADVVSRSGITSQSDIAALLQQFGGFTGSDKTMKGIEAANTAYQTYVQGTSATSGPQGTMRAAGFLNDPLISGMAGDDIAALAGVDTTQMGTDNYVVKQLAKKYKTTPDKIVAAARKAGDKSFHRRQKGDDLNSQLIAMHKKLATLPGTGGTFKERQQLRRDIEDKTNEYETELSLQLPPEIRNNPQAMRDLAEGMTSTNEEDRKKAMDRVKDAGKSLEGGTGATGRPEDKAVAAAAESSRLLLESFQKLHDQIIPTVTQVDAYNKALQRQVEIYNSLPDSAKAGYLVSGPGKMLNAVFPKNQTQTGSGSAPGTK